MESTREVIENIHGKIVSIQNKEEAFPGGYGLIQEVLKLGSCLDSASLSEEALDTYTKIIVEVSTIAGFFAESNVYFSLHLAQPLITSALERIEKLKSELSLVSS